MWDRGIAQIITRTIDAGIDVMRWPIVLLVVGACGGSDEGVLLVVEAPDGATAKRVEILLASADPATIVDVDNQRVAPTDLDSEPVRYYRQRAITGEVDNVGSLDGFAVRLEPNIDIPEGALIPILVGFDDQDQITAIGAVMDNGMPAPVEIAEDQLLRFSVTMNAMAPAGEDGVATNEVVSVACGSFRSGIAWRPGATQLRLLLPDRETDPDATDASGRALDLDCDGALAAAGDCDDLRGEFHVGAEERCDGMDYDCDFRAQELVSCDVGTTCGQTTGVGICNDRPDAGGIVACAPEPECACVNGQCAQCLINFEAGLGAVQVTPCTPALASQVFLGACQGGCTVEVLKRAGDPFKITVSLPDTNTFTDKLTGVVDKIDIRAEASDTLSAAGNDIVGGIFLAIVRPNGTVSQLSFAIRLHEQESVCLPDGNVMACTQP